MNRMMKLAMAGVVTACTVAVGPAAPAAKNDRVVFTYMTHRFEPRGILSINPDGSGRTRLYKRRAEMPQWSPDRSKIAFVREKCETRRDCDSFILTMRPNGSDVSRVAGNADLIGSFDWSPDSARIVYSAFDQDESQYDLRIATLGQRRSELLIDTPDVWEIEPDWSPDGTEIVFHREAEEVNDIFVIAADGSNERNLTNDVHIEREPRWAPDGANIAFVTTRDDQTQGEDAPYTNQLFVMRPDGSEPRRISSDDDTRKFAPEWSDDSSKLAWFEQCDDDWCDRDWEIWVADVAEGEAQNITDDRRFYDQNPQWSPDGRRLIFLRWRGSSADTDIYSMRVDGSGLKRLTDTRGGESSVDGQTW